MAIHARLASLTVLMALLVTGPASAIVPMSATTLAQALAFGSTVDAQTLATDSEWTIRPSDNPYQPTFVIQTPFFYAAFMQAMAKKTYKEISKTVLHQFKTYNLISFQATLISSDVSGNDGATCVLKQQGKVIRPLSVSLGSQDVTDVNDGDPVFRRTVNCQFSLKAFNYQSPFTFVLANISTGLGYGLEKSYDLDPTTFR